MKAILRIIPIILILLSSTSLFGQAPGYQVIAKNDVLVDSRNFEFDIYIIKLNASDTLQFASLQVGMYFDNAIKNGGTLSGLYIAGTSEFTNSAQYPNNPNLNFVSGSNGQFRIAPKAPPGAGNGSLIPTSPGTRFGRFRITNTVDYPSLAPNFFWNFTTGTGQYATIISAYLGTTNTNITNQTNFLNQLSNAILPVELESFSASPSDRNVVLNWETKTETNTSVFEIERAAKANDEVVTDWLSIGQVNASGTSTSPKQYSFVDNKLQSGKYQYRLKIVDLDGSFEYSKIVESEVALPKEYAISQNYPNPFNPTTRIDYQLPFDSKVTLELYGITGEKVGTILNEEQSAGYYTAEVNSSRMNLASGIYIYRMTANNSAGQNFVQVKKLMLMK